MPFLYSKRKGTEQNELAIPLGVLWKTGCHGRYDLQLDVKGCQNVYASFDKYVEVETLEGDNKYQAEGHGLQDAKTGVLFSDFPPVLQLQLKRFEYDFMQDTTVKIYLFEPSSSRDLVMPFFSPKLEGKGIVKKPGL